jgi:ADP-heptose:LPS heptosyltransferase
MVQGLMDASAVDLAGMTDLGEFAAVISALDLLVTNDTGASHVAAATRARSIVLFGPTLPERWAPLDRRRHHAIDATTRPGAPDDRAAALRALPVAEVLTACDSILRGEATADSRVLDEERIAWVG